MEPTKVPSALTFTSPVSSHTGMVSKPEFASRVSRSARTIALETA